jgi:hypothetical protein
MRLQDVVKHYRSSNYFPEWGCWKSRAVALSGNEAIRSKAGRQTKGLIRRQIERMRIYIITYCFLN